MTDNKAALDALENIATHAINQAGSFSHMQEFELVQEQVKLLRAYIATPPAPTVMGDDVQSAIVGILNSEELLGDFAVTIKDLKDPDGVSAEVHFQTLILAATQPPQPYPSGLQKATVHVLLDTLAAAARGETLDPETCQQIEGIAKEYNHKDFTQDDALALYRCGHHKQPPQATDAQRREALDILNRIEYYVLKHDPRSGIKDPCDKATLNRAQIDTIKAALQSPAVPREDIKIRAEWIIASDDKSQMRLIAHEILALLGGKEGK